MLKLEATDQRRTSGVEPQLAWKYEKRKVPILWKSDTSYIGGRKKSSQVPLSHQYLYTLSETYPTYSSQENLLEARRID
jgi:hypothetical protein